MSSESRIDCQSTSYAVELSSHHRLTSLLLVIGGDFQLDSIPHSSQIPGKRRVEDAAVLFQCSELDSISISKLVYTGSDDCKFSCWDLREDPSNLAFQNRKVHTMGICCITKRPSDPYTLLTGCYDEHLRVWDVRSISKPVHETSISLGGGVWRIKYHPSVPNLVLTACMHNGFAVVKVKGDTAEVIETYNKHGSLAYGADWQRGLGRNGRGKNNVIATCSFYDQLLRVWIPEGDIPECDPVL